MKTRAVAIATVIGAFSVCAAQNQIINGDFTQGEVGFTGSANHAVTTDPSLVNPSAVSFLDHTKNVVGPRNMLYAMPVDISQAYTTEPIWTSQVTIVTGITYDWVVWVAKTHPADYTVGISMRFGGGGGADRIFGVDIPTGEWRRAWVPVGSLSGTYTLSLYAIGDPGITHDLAIDDVSFTPAPEPATVLVLAVGLGIATRLRRAK